MNAADSRFLAGTMGRLDSRWHGPMGGPPVLVLHPHPQMGGSMGSRLVFDLATALASHKFRVLRFDYRGVGRSEGAYGNGIGEVQDAAVAFDALAHEAGRPPAVVGYSFGGGVAARLARLRRPNRLVLVATPARFSDAKLDVFADAAKVQCPATVVVGDKDPFVAVRDAQRMAEAFLPPARLIVLPGAPHFLEPSQNAAAVEAVRAALA